MANSEVVYVSLRKDMKHVEWSGPTLHPEVDIHFRLTRIKDFDGCRAIIAAMTRPGHVCHFEAPGHFDLDLLGKDYANLPNAEAEMVVVSRHMESIAASTRNNGFELMVRWENQSLRLLVVTGISGRWDWFVRPEEMSPSAHPEQEAAAA